jgi:ribosome maturation factor RimP
MIGGQKVFQGKLLGLAGEAVKVELESGEVVEIPLRDVAKASLEVEF